MLPINVAKPSQTKRTNSIIGISIISSSSNSEQETGAYRWEECWMEMNNFIYKHKIIHIALHRIRCKSRDQMRKCERKVWKRAMVRWIDGWMDGWWLVGTPMPNCIRYLSWRCITFRMVELRWAELSLVYEWEMRMLRRETTLPGNRQHLFTFSHAQTTQSYFETIKTFWINERREVM